MSGKYKKVAYYPGCALEGTGHAYNRSTKALAKVHSRRLEDGNVVHSFRTLLSELTTIVRNTCRPPGTAADTATFEMTTRPNPTQARAAELLQTIAA